MALIADNMKKREGAQEAAGEEQEQPGGKRPPEGRDALPPARGASSNEERDGEQPNVSPEEQAAYDSVVTHAMNMIYGERSFQQVMKMIQSAGDPAEGVAQAAVMILSRIYESSRKQGQPISDDVMMAAGEEVIALLFELIEEAGLGEASEDAVFTATARALQLWAETYPDKMDQAGMEQSASALPKEELASIAQRMGGGQEKKAAE
jgi:hypothetical protein